MSGGSSSGSAVAVAVGVVEILNRVEPRFGSPLMAYAWFRSESLAGFGGLTAMHLVREGRAAEVHDYIDAVDAGVYA